MTLVAASYRWDVMWSRSIEEIRAERLVKAKFAKSRRYFRGLSNEALTGWSIVGDVVNRGRASREIRRRARLSKEEG